jgi:glycosyltransferase involved in cell wall biosynthesis
MAAKGVKPDLIVGHCGWGETLFLKEIWPGAKQLLYAEFYTRPYGLDVDFDPEFPKPDLQGAARVHTKYGAMLLAMSMADAYVSPTHFQASTFPDMFRDRIQVLHAGVDTAWLAPDPSAELKLPDSDIVLRPGDEVVTYVNRYLEPMRGLHIFLRALPAVLSARPNARVVVVGGAGADAYGLPPPQGSSWKDQYLKKLDGKLDPKRVHFLGRVDKPLYRSLLSISAAHVYLTYPFVLSWSLLEAMSAGCLVIASDTAPLREVVQDGVNGRLVDFFDVKGFSDRIIEALAEPARFTALRKRAREDVAAT